MLLRVIVLARPTIRKGHNKLKQGITYCLPDKHFRKSAKPQYTFAIYQGGSFRQKQSILTTGPPGN
jgi:hypothetical protein